MPTKVRLVKAMVFPVVMYGYESWTIKKAECQRIDAFELWCWRSPLDCKEIQLVHPKGNKSWILIGRTGAEVETPVLWPPDVKSWLTGKDPDAGKDWRWEEKGTPDDEMASLTWWTWVWVNYGSWWWIGKPGVLQSMESQRVRHDWVTELNWIYLYENESTPRRATEISIGIALNLYISLGKFKVLTIQNDLIQFLRLLIILCMCNHIICE